MNLHDKAVISMHDEFDNELPCWKATGHRSGIAVTQSHVPSAATEDSAPSVTKRSAFRISSTRWERRKQYLSILRYCAIRYPHLAKDASRVFIVSAITARCV